MTRTRRRSPWLLTILVVTIGLASIPWHGSSQEKRRPPLDPDKVSPTPPPRTLGIPPQAPLPPPPSPLPPPPAPPSEPAPDVDATAAPTFVVPALEDVSTMADALAYCLGFTFQSEPWTEEGGDYYVRIARVTDEVVILQRGRKGVNDTFQTTGDYYVLPISRFNAVELDTKFTAEEGRHLVSDKVWLR